MSSVAAARRAWTYRGLVALPEDRLRHELIDGEPGVRDAGTLRAFYLRVGYERAGGGLYESESALEAGRRVAAELAAARAVPSSPLR